MEYYVHNIDPVLIQLGSLQVRYYGLMYLTGFVVGYFIFKYRYNRALFALNPEKVQDLFTYIMVGMILGARIFYVFIYNWDQYKHNVWEVFYIWQGGLSFHGALVGFIIAMIFFTKKYKIGFWHLADHVTMGAALGIFFGRIGNFTNGELWGRPTDVAWAMIFPAADNLPRHPSQLYQAFGEGLCVFLILLLIDYRERKKHLKIHETKTKLNASWNRSGITAASFLILYGVARFIIEFFREPDPQLGYYFSYFSMGQILCFLMILPGIYFLYKNLKELKIESYSISK